MIYATDRAAGLLDQLENVTGDNGQWQARCPSHDDNRASLSVATGDDGRVLLHCQAGCATADIVGALNIKMKDLMPPSREFQRNGRSRSNGKSTIAETYDYCDADGNLLFQALRMEPKGFRQRRPDGNGGWVWSVKGCAVVPYRLPELLKSNDTIFVVEGEKDVHSIESIGLFATCNAAGAGKWKSGHAKYLANRNVVIFPDNDDSGRKHAQQVAKSLEGAASSIKVVELPSLNLKGDVSDWIEAHGDAAEPNVIAEQLREIVEGSQTWADNSSDRPQRQEQSYKERNDEEHEPPRELISYTRITSAELAEGDYALEYLIKDAMVAGQPLIIAGPQKVLKTSFLIDAAVSLASCGWFLGRLPVTRPCRVAVMTGESGLATIQETAIRVCQAAGKFLSDLDNLFWSPDLPKFGDHLHLEALETFLTADEIEVLFIDPAYLCMPGGDAGNIMVQGELLRSVSELCRGLGVTMVLAHHTKKHTGRDVYSPGELSDIAWSGFAEFARQWWLITRREEYEVGTGQHKLWLSVGGSAGHSALWAVDVNEGVRSDHSARTWEVELSKPHEAAEDAEQRKEASKGAAKQKQLESDIDAILKATASLEKCQGTKTGIRTATGINQSRFDVAFASAIRGKHLAEIDITKGNNRKYEGYRLADSETEIATEHP